MIKTEFMNIYEELSMLNEAKVDIERFINKFGEDTYDLFKKSTQRLKNKGISTDILYHVKHTDKKDLDTILYNLQNRTITKAGSLTELAGDYEYLGEDKGYKVYKINDVIASINLGAGTGWCISGRYGHYGEKNYTPAKEEAEKHWDEYTSRGIQFYFFIGTNSKVALALYPKVLTVNRKLPDNSAYVESTNIEIYNEQDRLDYSLFDKLPIDLIKEELVLKIQTIEKPSTVIRNNRLVSVDPDTEHLVIPNTVTRIAPVRSTSVKTITFEEGATITEIENYTFMNCTSLSNIVLPNSITKIGFAAFGGCSSLTSIIIPNSVTTIESHAFARCESLTSIVIPSTVTQLEEFAFLQCIKLKNIYCEAKSKPKGWALGWDRTASANKVSIEWDYKKEGDYKND